MKRLLIPAWHYRSCAVVEKKWGWSPLEEAVLLALRSTPGSVQSTSTALNLPRQVVSASVTRLMQHGLLEFRFGEVSALVLSEAGEAFLQTGMALPERVEHREIVVSFVYELLGQSIIRFRDARRHWRNPRGNKVEAIKIEFPKDGSVETYETMQGRAWTIIREDLRHGELEHSIQTTDARLKPGFLEIDLVDARDGVFPEGSTNELRTEVSEILKKNMIPKLKTRSFSSMDDPAIVEATFREEQLVVGGKEHLECFERVVDGAKEDVFVLSTYISGQNDQKNRLTRERLWSALDRAVGRGVRCHLFFGDKDTKHAMALEELRVRLCKSARSAEDVRVHYQAMNSHAKILAADDGAGGGIFLLGSCNWLSSPFNACELSIELNGGGALVAGLETFAATISVSPEASQSVDSLRALAADVKRWKSSYFSLWPLRTDEVQGRIRFLFSHQHDPFLRKVAHGGHERIMCASHRLGATMRTALFNPLTAGHLESGKNYVLFSRATAATKKKHVREEKKKAGEKVKTLSLKNPELHAKFLLWDDNDLIVSSMNWGSKQGSVHKPFDEIGVHISAPGVADKLLKRLQEHLPNLGSI